MGSSYFILSLDRAEYTVLMNSRSVNVPNHDELALEKGLLFLIYLKDENVLIAEYDLENYENKDNDITLNLEPIYNSPIGLQINDLLLLMLPTYSLEDWRDRLKTDLIPLTERDYDELVNRLKL